MKAIVGIDVSKYKFYTTCVRQNKEILFSMKFPNDATGFNNFLSILRNLSQTNEIIIAMESTGSYYINLASFLIKNNFRVKIINPFQTFSFNKISLRKTKTDKRDSKTIAEFALSHYHKLPDFSPEFIRFLARERVFIIKQIVQTKIRFKSTLSILFPELERYFNPFAVSIRKILYHFPSPSKIANLSSNEILTWLNKRKGHKYSTQQAQLLKEIANSSIGKFSENFFLEKTLISQIEILNHLEKSLKSITTTLVQIGKVIFEREVKIITSVKGISELQAVMLMSEIKDIRRFPEMPALRAYLGIDPTVYESGNFKGKSKISKRGNRYARRIIWIMSVMVSKYNPYFANYFTRKRMHKPTQVAYGAVANKLIRVIYALVTHNTHFNHPV